jgi:hypothetical protein
MLLTCFFRGSKTLLCCSDRVQCLRHSAAKSKFLFQIASYGPLWDTSRLLVSFLCVFWAILHSCEGICGAPSQSLLKYDAFPSQPSGHGQQISDLISYKKNAPIFRLSFPRLDGESRSGFHWSERDFGRSHAQVTSLMSRCFSEFVLCPSEPLQKTRSDFAATWLLIVPSHRLQSSALISIS